MDSLLVTVFQISTGICWSIVYILIIKQGMKDKSTGMPMEALCANISWEFIFSFIYPHTGLQGFIDIIWFALDVIILIQFMKYGRKEFAKTLPMKYFYPTLLITITLSFLIIMATVQEFNDFEGKYAAFSQNFMMSCLYISLLLKRGNSRGQSLSIAILKMIGSFIPALAFFIYFRSGLIIILSIGSLIFDLVYIVLIFNKLRKEKIAKLLGVHG
jgi:hypothetical protein